MDEAPEDSPNFTASEGDPPLSGSRFQLHEMPRLFVPGQMPGMNEIIDARGTLYGPATLKSFLRPNEYQAIKKKWCGHIAKMAVTVQFPRYEEGYVNLFCFEPHARRDFDNVVSGASKLLLDALVAAERLPGDGRRVVKSVRPWMTVCKERPGVTCIITADRHATDDEAAEFMSWWMDVLTLC